MQSAKENNSYYNNASNKANKRNSQPTKHLKTKSKELESGCLTTLYSYDDCQRRVPISCVRRQASDPWMTLTTVGESGDGALPGPLPDVGSSVM